MTIDNNGVTTAVTGVAIDNAVVANSDTDITNDDTDITIDDTDVTIANTAESNIENFNPSKETETKDDQELPTLVKIGKANYNEFFT